MNRKSPILTSGLVAMMGLFAAICMHGNALAQYNLVAQKDGAVASDKLGWALAGAGDVNGDGVPDYIVGIPYADPSGMSSAGSAIVYSGANGTVLYQKNGAAAGSGLGYWVGGAGDVNGDGRADFLVANQATAWVYSGANGAQLYSKPSAGPVAGVGDVNGDGRADFIVSDLVNSYVYSGANGALLYAKVGGSAVAGAGDVNGDGRADFIVGDQYADPGLTNAGTACVYSGANGSLIYQKNGAVGSDLLGSSVGGLGDVNGDGRADFIVGARLADISGVINTGAAYVFSGATGAQLYRKNGAGGEQWGQAVSGAGDADGDGRGDFLVGTIWTSPGGHTSAGSAFLFSGATGAQLARFDGKSEYENCGYTLAAIGDITGNGRSEFLVGGPNASPAGRLNAGSAYIYGSGSTVDPCQSDVTPPSLICAADKTAGCGQAIVFNTPTATDNCDPAPVITIVSTTQTPGPGPNDVTHTRTWNARDARGNVSANCSQDIVYTCIQTATYHSQVVPSTAGCAAFSSQTAADLADACVTLKRGKVFSSTPKDFNYFVSLTAPSSSFTVDIVQTRTNNILPLIGVASGGVTLLRNCASVATGTSPSAGQARVSVTGATVGATYVVSVLFSTTSLSGTNVGTVLLNPIEHYDFSARMNGLEITRDADGLDFAACSKPHPSKEVWGAPDEVAITGYPNPFNASTRVTYYLPDDGPVRVDVFNILGRPVKSLVDANMVAGEYDVLWNGTDDQGRGVPSGVYLITVRTRDEQVVGRFSLLK